MNSSLSDFLNALTAGNKNPALLDFSRYFGDVKNLEMPPSEIPNAPIERQPRASVIPNDKPITSTLIESPTFYNAPPVGQTGNPDPLPFFKYAPPVGQNVINWTPQNPDERITIDEAPPVPQNLSLGNLDKILRLLNIQGY